MGGNEKKTGKPDKSQDKKPSGGLFGQKFNPDVLSQEIAMLRQENNSLSRRVRELEERQQNFRKKVSLLDNRLLSVSKKQSTDFRVMQSELNEIKAIIDEFDNKMLLLIKELQHSARVEDVRVLQRYIDMWEPIRFVTRREVERIIQTMLEKKLEEEKALNK